MLVNCLSVIVHLYSKNCTISCECPWCELSSVLATEARIALSGKSISLAPDEGTDGLCDIRDLCSTISPRLRARFFERLNGGYLT